MGKSLQEKELQAFKEDVEDLPEQASMVRKPVSPVICVKYAVFKTCKLISNHRLKRDAPAGSI